MTIQEAREAALQGKTVTCPSGFNYSKASFSNVEEWDRVSVFGEWQLQSENDTVVFETIAELADASLFGAGRGLISDRRLHPLRNKKVRVTVEVLP